MKLIKRTLALIDVLLLLPAALFMAALMLRGVQLLQYEPAHTAQGIVLWYADRIWTLWILLIALPLAVLVNGGLTLLGNWPLRPDPREAARTIRMDGATWLIAASTLAAGVVLAIAAIHMMLN